VDRKVGEVYQVTRPPTGDYANFALRIAYLIDPDGVIRKAYEVSDVGGFAAEVLTDLHNLQKS
jgi:peroxiredoxin